MSFVLVTLAALLARSAYQRLPGHSGLAGELHWLLTRPAVRTCHYNRASQLLVLAEAKRAGSRGFLLAKLLADPDPHLVSHAVTLLADQIEAVGRGDPEVMRTFLAWLGRATDDCKLRNVPQLVRCIAAIPTGVMAVHEPPRPAWADNRELLRWVAAAATHPEPQVREQACEALAGSEAYGLRQQLDAFECLPRGTAARELLLPAGPKAVILREKPAMVALLDDPVPQVRWAAGRLLVLVAESAAVPTVCEWIIQHPQYRRSAEEVMAAVFGGQWRELCESRGSASQPGAGDGGE